jgi:AraC-like DNA-binding protein
VKTPVLTSQVAATILKSLGIDPSELEPVRKEGIPVTANGDTDMPTQAYADWAATPAKGPPGGRTILVTWVKAICRALDAAGCDSAALVAEAGVDAKLLDHPTARCLIAPVSRLWKLAVAATGDAAFGLKVASHIKHTTFHALSYGLCASSTLKEAFERVQRYCHVASDAIERTLDGGNPELARQNDAIAFQYLSQLERDNIRGRVREVLTERLARGEPSQAQVAEILNTSARTLQRKLGEKGTTYKEILDETRKVLALAYLSAPRHTVSDVTYLLGFSAGSSFTRAFRRWTGQSPSDWRACAGTAVAVLQPASAVDEELRDSPGATSATG